MGLNTVNSPVLRKALIDVARDCRTACSRDPMLKELRRHPYDYDRTMEMARRVGREALIIAVSDDMAPVPSIARFLVNDGYHPISASEVLNDKRVPVSKAAWALDHYSAAGNTAKIFALMHFLSDGNERAADIMSDPNFSMDFEELLWNSLSQIDNFRALVDALRQDTSRQAAMQLKYDHRFFAKLFLSYDLRPTQAKADLFISELRDNPGAITLHSSRICADNLIHWSNMLSFSNVPAEAKARVLNMIQNIELKRRLILSMNPEARISSLAFLGERELARILPGLPGLVLQDLMRSARIDPEEIERSLIF